MKTAVYPGTFDPVTNGHLDVITRASKLFDIVIVGVLTNSAKSPLFSVEERVNILTEVTKAIPNIQVKAFSGLSIEFARKNQANVIVRGLRAVTDFDYELQMAQTNRRRRIHRKPYMCRYHVSDHQPGMRLLKFHDSKRSGRFRRRYYKICPVLRSGTDSRKAESIKIQRGECIYEQQN